MKRLSLFMSITFAVLLMACSSSSDDDMTPTPDPNAKVTYNGNIKSLISSNCGSCHGSTPSNGAPSSAAFDTYAKVKAAANNIITRTNSAANPMPASGLMSTANRNLIKKWKSDGLLEN